VSQPVIGIVGSAGAYGRWLQRFFEQRMGLRVHGQDPADPASLSPQELLASADVLVFSAPIRHTVAIIEQYVALAAGREARQLWLDVTSIKAGPIAAMARSQAEVAGLHPMTAPPKAPTLKGRATVICELRLHHWRDWFGQLLQALEGEYVRATPEQHDRVMALVQAMVHASHLAQAGVLRGQAGQVGDLAALMPFRSASFEMDAAILSRILALNPAIYEDIQFGNPHAGDVLAALGAQLARMAELVAQGDEAVGDAALASGNYHYERIGYLLADLAGVRAISVHLPEDRPGSLRELLQIFEREGISLSSIHSSRTPEGEVHFRIGFEAALEPHRLQQAAHAIAASGLGRILEIPA